MRREKTINGQRFGRLIALKRIADKCKIITKNMENRINEQIIKIRGGASIGESLKTDNDYRLGLDVSVVEAQKKSNQDGTFDIVFICKLIGGEVLKDNGETMLMKDKGRQSQKLRRQILASGEDYNDIMNFIRSHFDEILDMKYKLHE